MDETVKTIQNIINLKLYHWFLHAVEYIDRLLND